MFEVKDAQRFAEIAQEQVYDSRDRYDKDWQEFQEARMEEKDALPLAESAHAQVHDRRERYRSFSAGCAAAERMFERWFKAHQPAYEIRRL